MKSYKDIDREIILNAPEGAMWYNHENAKYYTYNGKGVVYLDHSGKWSNNSAWFDLSKITAGDLIPLPNIEIPWEATAESVCPVPDGIYVKCQFDDGEDSVDSNPEGWRWNNKTQFRDITSYKIIDEEFLDKAKPIQEEPIHVPELEMHRAAYQAIKNAGFESPEELLAEHLASSKVDVKLFNKLRFLQNLANEFPEIRNEAIKFMECELDGYMNTLWEKDNDE